MESRKYQVEPEEIQLRELPSTRSKAEDSADANRGGTLRLKSQNVLKLSPSSITVIRKQSPSFKLNLRRKISERSQQFQERQDLDRHLSHRPQTGQGWSSP